MFDFRNSKYHFDEDANFPKVAMIGSGFLEDRSLVITGSKGHRENKVKTITMVYDIYK